MASTIKVTNIDTPDGTGSITIDRPTVLQAGDIVTADIADDAVTTVKVLDANVTTAKVADNAITLAKMAGGTDGNIISYDASGDPVAVVTGSSGQVLTSAGAGAPPTFAAAAGGGNSFFAIATRNVATATGTFTVTGLGFAPNSLVVTALITTTDAYAWGYACDNASDNGACFHSVGGDSSDALHNNGSFFARTPTSAGNDADFAISSWDSDGITIQHTKSGSPTGTATLNIMFFG